MFILCLCFVHKIMCNCVSKRFVNNTDLCTTVIISVKMGNIKLSALVKLFLILPIITASLRLYKNCEECDIPPDMIDTQPRLAWPWMPGYKSDGAGYMWPLYFSR